MGRSFIIRTDAEANEYIFNGEHRIGKRATSRAEAWALRLQPYDFTIERVTGESNVADSLSRLIQDSKEAVPFEEENENHYLFSLDSGLMDLTLNEIEGSTEQDSDLQLILSHLNSKKWPSSLIEFAPHRQSIHHIGSLLYKDDRLILPKALRIKALSSAHAGHIGEVAMKRILRQFFWWPCISKEAELFVKRCKTCTMLSKKDPPISISSRTLPDGPWEELQIDFLSIPGFGTGEFLIIVDTYSRFLSVCEMRRTDADSTNAALCDVFKLWGLPKIIQSDNGPPFQSSAFCNYWEEKAVMIRKSIPLCPQSNGCVERQNQGIIKALAASRIDGSNWRVALHKYVHNHNTLIPHARLNVTPFELLVGWKFRGTFPSLWHTDNVKSLNREEVKDRDTEAKFTSKSYADTRRGAKDSNLQVGDKVLLAQQKKTKTDPNFSSEYYRSIRN
ncbi:uncharacterized protein K02A2.6-like [Uranotaenia lowii]|uniref:uncharacterized protein K02A2.6-like n=1 Tax=Uranotaenia lowii TaxID=190385 RepID=UPI0024798B18|nr:uncharacterized protein K02A2.6-like [Uranotaenia lowii]